MKNKVTQFDLNAAFRALDEIEIPTVPAELTRNEVNLKESIGSMRNRTNRLVEDFYDVSDDTEMAEAESERDAEIALAKLNKIEKIVDLDAKSPEDLLPSYAGKYIIQCPQCMQMFYKDPADVERSEEDDTLCNVGEVCQHCKNDSGYTLIGKVAAAEEDTSDDFDLGSSEETDTDDLDLDLDTEDDLETSEEEGMDSVEDEETDLDDLDLDLDLGDEDMEESLNNSKLLKQASKNTELDTDFHSKNLTLNEDLDTKPEEEDLSDSTKELDEDLELTEDMMDKELIDELNYFIDYMNGDIKDENNTSDQEEI